MGAVDKFLYKLVHFDKENIPAKVIKALETYLKVSNVGWTQTEEAFLM